jgi:CTP synthase
VASQYHPEFKSRPERPAPLFREFVRAAQSRATERRPETAAETSDAAVANEIRASRIESPH